MDKYEFNIKVEQIKKLVAQSDYETAMKIADTIDWRRVRNTTLLSMVANVYEKNEDYEEAKEIILLAYERAPIGKRLLYKLAELAIKEGNVDEAEAYYREFTDLAPDDPRQQLLRYLILKEKGAPAQQLIHSLESYTSKELDERWLYELAELYSLAGMPERCIETCDRIMLMFGLGQYVDKAMELKVRYAPLSGYQKDLVENRDKYEAKLKAVQQEYSIGGNRMSEPEEEYYDDEDSDMGIQGQYNQDQYSHDQYNQDQYGEDQYNQDQYGEDQYIQDDYNQDQGMEFYDRGIPHVEMPEDLSDEFEARVQEAAAQEDLAREMSRISYTEPEPEEESEMERTRVLDDIRRVGRTAAAMPRPRAVVPPSEPVYLEPVHFEPIDFEAIIEEDITEEAVTEEEAIEEDVIEGNISEEDIAEDGEDIIEDIPDNAIEDSFADEPVAGEEASEKQAIEEESDSEEETETNLEIEDLEEEQDKTQILNHLMIEARTPEKGLQMAVEALKQIHKETGVKNPVAKITGSKLSKRGVLSSAEKLAGKDLIVEEAGDLTPEALEELYELMNHDTSGMIVVLIDNPKQMETLHREQPALASKFECIGSGEETPAASASQSTVSLKIETPQTKKSAHIKKAPDKEPSYEEELEERAAYERDSYEQETQNDPEEEEFYEDYEEHRPSVTEEEGPGFHGEEMDIDEFAEYACRYANEIDCSITGKSMLALYERIEIMEEDNIALTRVNAEDLIEEVADRAEKPSFGKRVKGLFSSKYDKDGLLILKEEHFIY